MEVIIQLPIEVVHTLLKAETVENIKKENTVSYAEAVRRVEGTSGVRQVRADFISRKPTKGIEVFACDDMVMVSMKMLLAFMVEELWKVKLVANKISDVARGITTAAEKSKWKSAIWKKGIYRK